MTSGLIGQFWGEKIRHRIWAYQYKEIPAVKSVGEFFLRLALIFGLAATGFVITVLVPKDATNM